MSDRSQQALERALLTILRRLVRLLLTRGFAWAQLAELVKRAYVEVAASDFAVEGRKPSISRIAVVTGLTRKEASRLIGQRGDPEEADSSSRCNRAARVPTAWSRESRFANKRGGPASLPFEAESGPSLSELVRLHGADVPARAVLDETRRRGSGKTTSESGRIADEERPADRSGFWHIELGTGKLGS